MKARSRVARYRLIELSWLWVSLCVAPAVGQPTDPPDQRVLLAADETSLWLARAAPRPSLMFHRDPAGPLDRGRSVDALISVMGVIEDDLLVFLEDGSAYRYPVGGTSGHAAYNLPRRAKPLSLASYGHAAYALVDSEIAAELGPSPSSAPQAIEFGLAALSVVHFDGRAWTPLAPAPSDGQPLRSPGLGPRLTCTAHEIHFVWMSQSPRRIEVATCDQAGGTWRRRASIEAPNIRAFWATSWAGVLTVITARPDASLGEGPGGAPCETLTAYRLLGADDDGAWTSGELEIAPLPEQRRLCRILDVQGFNQHLAILAHAMDGAPWLTFARSAGERLTETALNPAEIFEGPGAEARVNERLQQISFLVLLCVLIGLFVFRRDSMITQAPLGADLALAYRYQRLIAFLIDFVPFTYLAALAMGLAWRDAISEIWNWALNPDPQSYLPARAVLTWWALACGGYSAYSLLLEIMLGGTLGKLLMGVRVVSETGGRPRWLQIVVRNALRLIELTPQFWVFVVLLFASRNRQRLGDIFARTVVVRRVAPPPSSPSQSDDGPREAPGEELLSDRDE